jgi:hypothetical protein
LSSDICIFSNGQPDRDDDCRMFDSDGQQFKQRQQNEQSHHIFTHWTKTYNVRNPCPGLDR